LNKTSKYLQYAAYGAVQKVMTGEVIAACDYLESSGTLY